MDSSDLLLLRQFAALMEGERNAGANSANLTALVFHSLPNLNWVGFYWSVEGELVLGPFQGKPAVSRIPFARGICGLAARTLSVQIVSDVHAHPDHIACDPQSRSECVLPLLSGQRLLGVLDIDSPVPGRFSEREVELFAALLDALLKGSDFSQF